MSRNKLYRSSLVVVVAGAGFFAGCADAGKKHVTIKEEQYNRWNMTRIAVMFQLATQQYEVGDYDKCKKTLAECLAMNAPHAGMHILSAKVDIEKGSLDTASDQLQQAIRINANDPEPYYLLGVIYQRWQKPDVAADFYTQAFERKSDNPLYLLAVVEMKITLGKLDEAKKLLNDKLIYFEQTGAIRVALGRIASLQGDKELACKYYRDAVLLLPDDSTVRRSYAEVLFDAGKYADAAPIFDDLRHKADTDAAKAAADPKSAEAQSGAAEAAAADKVNLLMMLGQCYLELRRPYDARNTFQEITRDHPDDAQAFVGLARACIGTNELPVALAAARKVSRVEPENVDALLLAATAQQKMKKWADAETTLMAAQHLSPDNGVILCMLGICAERQNRPTAAADYYHQALTINPNDSWATELLSQVSSSPVSMAPVQNP
ncbi:MAG TPA: tetratricopeptide repeat protein [Phycisphaerae bacterium]|jgi:tetratricopeptide (TPR) repeat protein|nr:tetratricopeptide repeat protein [Phycisphaerae bacterium]